MPMFYLFACTPTTDTAARAAPDAATVLVELATEATTDLLVGVYFGVGEDRLLAMVDGDELSGSLTLPDDADPDHWSTDGALTAAWDVEHRVDADIEGLRYWDWTITLEISALALPSADVSGTATWTIVWESYDYQFGLHAWEGTLSIDDAETVPAEFHGVATWSMLNTLDGSIDGEAVEWQSATPDLP